MSRREEDIRDHEGCVLFVGNLPYRMDSPALEQIFSPVSEVIWAEVVVDHHHRGVSKGFGFVRLPTGDDAARCIEAKNGLELEGRALTVNTALHNANRPRREWYRRTGFAPLATLPDVPRVLQTTVEVQRLLTRQYDRPESLLQLTERQFEVLIAEIFETLNYTVELTSWTRDGGYDIIAVCERELKLRVLIECKRYTPPHKVTVGVVRTLYGVKSHEKATKAVLATTSYLTRPAAEFVDMHRWELEARDAEGIIKWIQMAKSSKRTNASGLWVVDSDPGDDTDSCLPRS